MSEFPDRRVLQFWPEREQRLAAAHILDLLNLARKGKKAEGTPFLAPAMREWAEPIVQKTGLPWVAAGGFPDAERVRLIIGLSAPEKLVEEEWIALLQIVPRNKSAELEHRQVLGSMMGLGLERQVVGDIYAGRAGCYVAVLPQIAAFLTENWLKIGREDVQVSRLPGCPELEKARGEERRITVSSVRLDGMVAAGFNLSRTRAQELIKRGQVKLKDIAVYKQDADVSPGDKISCRGWGRILLLSKEETRKGRIAWTVEIFHSRR